MELIQHTMSVVNGQEIYVAPIGDIQFTGRAEDIAGDHLQAHLAYCQARNAYYVGTGDYVDLMSPSNRARLQSAALYDNTCRTIEDKACELTDALFNEYLAGTQGRWLGLVHGHHWTDCGDGRTTDQRLAERLQGPYLGTSGFITLDFQSADASQRHGQVTLWLHHGNGSGRAGAALNKLEQLAGSFDADFHIMGHTTKVSAAPVCRIYPVDGELHHKTTYLVNAGGWSKAYSLGSKRSGRPAGDYAEMALLSPAALGGAVIKIVPRWSARRWEPILRVEV